MEKIKDIIRKKLAEMSATGMGGATAIPGEGIGMSTKKAFKKVNEGPGATLGMGPRLHRALSDAPAVRSA